MYLFFDTETTGLSKGADRIIQIAWIVTDSVFNVKDEISEIIKPDGFSIPLSATAIHGITTAEAIRRGEHIRDVLLRLSNVAPKVTLLVAHNMSFDLAFLRAEFKRAGLAFPFEKTKLYCTMVNTTNLVRLPKFNGNKGHKWPKLQELHWYLFNKYFDNDHDAQADAKACMKCFIELKRKGEIVPDITNITRPDVSVIRSEPPPSTGCQKTKSGAPYVWPKTHESPIYSAPTIHRSENSSTPPPRCLDQAATSPIHKIESAPTQPEKQRDIADTRSDYVIGSATDDFVRTGGTVAKDPSLIDLDAIVKQLSGFDVSTENDGYKWTLTRGPEKWIVYTRQELKARADMFLNATIERDRQKELRREFFRTTLSKLLGLVRNPKTNSKLILESLDNPVWEEEQEDTALIEFRNSCYTQILASAASHPKVSPQIIERCLNYESLSTDAREFIQLAAARNPIASESVLGNLVGSEFVSVRLELTNRGDCPKSILRKLERDASEHIRRGAAKRLAPERDLLVQLAASEKMEDRIDAALDPECPEILLKKLKEDSEIRVRIAAKHRKRC